MVGFLCLVFLLCIRIYDDIPVLQSLYKELQIIISSFSTIVGFMPVLTLYIFISALVGCSLFSHRMNFDEQTGYVVTWQPRVYDSTDNYTVCSWRWIG